MGESKEDTLVYMEEVIDKLNDELLKLEEASNVDIVFFRTTCKLKEEYRKLKYAELYIDRKFSAVYTKIDKQLNGSNYNDLLVYEKCTADVAPEEDKVRVMIAEKKKQFDEKVEELKSLIRENKILAVLVGYNDYVPEYYYPMLSMDWLNEYIREQKNLNEELHKRLKNKIVSLSSALVVGAAVGYSVTKLVLKK